MQKQFSISEAKNRLPTIIHYVEKGPYVEFTIDIKHPKKFKGK